MLFAWNVSVYGCGSRGIVVVAPDLQAGRDEARAKIACLLSATGLCRGDHKALSRLAESVSVDAPDYSGFGPSLLID